jgi:hypothetical protein
VDKITYQAQSGGGACSPERPGRQSWSVVCRTLGATDRPVQTKHVSRADAMAYADRERAKDEMVSVIILEVVCLSAWSRYDRF